MSYDDYDEDGIGIVYPLSIFFALGIWLVFQRYHSIRNRAVPFRVRTPDVSIAPGFMFYRPLDAYAANWSSLSTSESG